MTEDHSLSDAEIAEIISNHKITSSGLSWEYSPEHTLFTVCRSPLENSDGIQIPGMFLELQFREGALVARCKYSFSLSVMRKGVRHLIMRLDVGPWDKCTHKEGKTRFLGAHLHIGKAILPIANNGLNCKDHADWFSVFCGLANIRHELKYRDPYEFELEMSP